MGCFWSALLCAAPLDSSKEIAVAQERYWAGCRGNFGGKGDDMPAPGMDMITKMAPMVLKMMGGMGTEAHGRIGGPQAGKVTGTETGASSC